MDIINTIINNINPINSSSGSGAGSNLPEKFLSDLGANLSKGNQSLNTGGNVTAQGNNSYLIKIPSLNNILQGTNSITIKTDKALENIGNFRLQADNYSFNNVSKTPTLTISGSITATNDKAQNQTIKFTSEIILTNKSDTSLNTNNTGNKTYSNHHLAKTDGVTITQGNRPNLLNLSAYTNKINPNITNVLNNITGSNNLKTDALTSYNLQINSFTYPSGKTINIPLPQGQNATPNIQNINGIIEYLPQNKETIIRTEFGNFRVPGELSLPNGSNVNFSITGISNLKPEAQITNQFNLNLTSVKTVLEAEGSSLQSLANNLSQLPHGNSLLHKLFPNMLDKQSFARSLWFISSSDNGNADKWLGTEGKNFIKNNFPNPESVLSNLKEVFGLLRSLNGNPQISNNPESWNNYILPFYDNNKLDFLSLYIQPRTPEQKSGKQQNSRKFLIELEQDSLGQLVVEGLFLEEGKRMKDLNLQLSASKGFSTHLIEELTILFSDISEAYGFTGKIEFSKNLPNDYKKIITNSNNEGIII